MGAVVEVEGHPAGSGPLALKFLREELLADDGAADRFRRELATHHRLTTGRRQVPRLVPCLAFDDGPDPATIHGIFPFYPDGNLLQFLESGAGSAVCLRILSDAVEGLQSMHGLRTVHRDFCPANIFVVREGGVIRGVLGDLGMAVPLDGNTVFDERRVADDLRLRPGHPGYIDRVHSGTSEGDLFSVGATLYRLLAGRDPAPVDEGPLSLPPPDACRPEVGRDLHRQANEVIERLTHPGVQSRYRDAAEARAAILSLAEGASTGEETASRRILHPALLLAGAGLLAAALWFGWTGWNGAGGNDAAGEIAANPSSEEGSLPDAVPESGRYEAENPTLDESGPAEGVTAQAPAPPPRPTLTPKPTPAPTPTPTPVPPVPRDLIARANALIGDGEYGRARALLEDAARRHPGDPDVAGLLAPLLARGGPDELDRAESLLSRALAGQPERGDLRLALARLEAQRGRMDRAVETLDAAPAGSSHRREIRALAVTLDRQRHRLE